MCVDDGNDRRLRQLPVPMAGEGDLYGYPLMKGYSFTPANQSVTVVKAEIKGVNFDAGPGSGGYSISGTITSEEAALPG